MSAGMSFYLFFLIHFLFCSNIATKYVCKAVPSASQVTLILENQLKNVYRYEFLLIFFNSFFILLYYSYTICLKRFKYL